jgi:hypothetical protein
MVNAESATLRISSPAFATIRARQKIRFEALPYDQGTVEQLSAYVIVDPDDVLIESDEGDNVIVSTP